MMILKRFLRIGIVAVALALVSAPLVPVTVNAACSSSDLSIDNGINCGAPVGSRRDLQGRGGIFVGVINTIILVVGALSILMIVIGGLRYVVSGGDPKGTEGAKNTILYAIVGLVIAIGAYAIVTTVINHF